ncbi:hypothetical protein IL45_02225 [Nonlabens ulvanivorans]|uniref:Uncharacterized protein n=1 Tax=Nonlabens ulvanivorans TaxID=906888 RepID=A0A084JZC8_NONUL|nr:hypothetical protein IL45_02225 [Nonlabens ulvanivorans]PRX09134.1 hypothetical protein LY02_02914 [Nonlabens ulvanivorans]
MIKLYKEDKEILEITLSKPGIFLINRVEDYYLLFLGYSLSKNNSILDLLDGYYTDYLKHKFQITEEMKWYKLIRLYSSTDIHTIELFQNTFSTFCKKNDIM